MLQGYKVICFVPAGRRRTLEILARYFQKHSDVVDHVMLWKNTPVQEDIDFLYQLEKTSPELFKVYDLPEGYKFYNRDCPVGSDCWGPVQWNTGRFFEYCTDPEAIYIRFDDDIVYIDDDYFQNMVKFRIEHPEYFLVFGNIWNNAIISYILQQEGKIGTEKGIVKEPYCMDLVGWKDPFFAEYIHELFLNKKQEGKVSDLFMNGGVEHPLLKWMGSGYELWDKHRFSISNFSFFGKDFAKFNGKFPDLDEEIFLTEIYPMKTGKMNVICGDALCVHFTFSPGQKPHILNNTDLLQRFGELSKRELEKAYYKMLNTHED